MTRTDIHAPASADFDPQAYDCHGVWDMDFGVSDGYPDPVAKKHHMETVNGLREQGYRLGNGSRRNCGHCGTHIRYAALMVREDAKEFIYVGETCLDGRFEMTQSEFQSLRETASLNRDRVRKSEKIAALLADNPALVWASYADNIGEAGGVETYWGFTDMGTHYQQFASLEEAQASRFSHETRRIGTWAEQTKKGWEISTLSDIWYKVERYGDPSDKQIAFVERLVNKLTEAEERRAAREAQTVALTEAGVEVPEGRFVVEGTVLSTKWVDNDFGGSLKMLVQNDAGWKVWGTVPSSIDPSKGSRVRFTAKVTRSNDDSLFGFYSRPTKAEVV